MVMINKRWRLMLHWLSESSTIRTSTDAKTAYAPGIHTPRYATTIVTETIRYHWHWAPHKCRALLWAKIRTSPGTSYIGNPEWRRPSEVFWSWFARSPRRMIPVSKPIPVQVIELHLPIVSLSWLEEKTTSKPTGTSYGKEVRNYMKTFKS